VTADTSVDTVRGQCGQPPTLLELQWPEMRGQEKVFGLEQDGIAWGIYAGGPLGIFLTASWLLFPIGRIIFKRIKTRPRD
jgi:hypothetical protein